jgi:hypothetical protein
MDEAGRLHALYRGDEAMTSIGCDGVARDCGSVATLPTCP